jgi:hypothetical protein
MQVRKIGQQKKQRKNAMNKCSHLENIRFLRKERFFLLKIKKRFVKKSLTAFGTL